MDLDLTPDHAVSRPHARIWSEAGIFWVEDLGSRRGTLVNGEKLAGPRPLHRGDAIQVGETTLRMDVPPAPPEAPHPPHPEACPGLGDTMDARGRSLLPLEGPAATEAERRLRLLCELPLELARLDRLDSVLQLILERVVEGIPAVERGAVMLRERDTGRLVLKAHHPPGSPAASTHLARRAMDQKKAFLWSVDREPAGPMQEAPASALRYEIESAMYAPLVWEDEAIGVVCVDRPGSCIRFLAEDLSLLLAMAHYAAMAVAHHYSRADLQSYAEFTHRLFCSRFPPRVREHLLQAVRRDALPLGTRRSEVTVLSSDIRGFTGLTKRLGAQQVSDLLNEYFPALIDVIFRHGGTVERFVGDAIFAVFGSPQPDPSQHEHAVRAALGMQAVTSELAAGRSARGLEVVDIGIGIHSGEVLHGFIGSAGRLEFAVVGDAANLANRYCSAAGPGQVLISPAVFERVWNLFATRKVEIEAKHEGALPAYVIERDGQVAAALA